MIDLSSLVTSALSSDYFYLKVVGVVISACFLIRAWESGPLTFYYDRENKLMTEFLEKSNIKKMVFKPYFLCLNGTA